MRHFSYVRNFLNKPLYSLPPSVGQSAAEPMQVTSGIQPGCTQGCGVPHFHGTTGPCSLLLGLLYAESFTHSAELSVGAICLTVRQTWLQQEQKFGRKRQTRSRSAGSHTSPALLSRSFEIFFIFFLRNLQTFHPDAEKNLRAPCQLQFSVIS